MIIVQFYFPSIIPMIQTNINIKTHFRLPFLLKYIGHFRELMSILLQFSKLTRKSVFFFEFFNSYK